MKHFEQYQDMIARLYPELTEESRVKNLSRNVTFQVTDACNLACTYCYQCNKGHRRMKFEYAKKLIDMILTGDEKLAGYVDIKSSPAIILEFIGGEPFLEVELIDQICDYFMDKAIEMCHQWATMFAISICSNGVLYFDEKVQKFLNKWKGKMSFNVTIDGNKELHDACRVFPDGSPSYDLAVAAANDWMSRGYFMGSKITIAPGNINYMYDAIIHMVELGYDEIHANTVYEKGWTLEHAKIYYNELKRLADYWIDNDLVETHYLALFEENFFKPKDENDVDNWCGGTGLMLAMDPDGYLYPCIRYMESSLGPDIKPLRIGHVNEGIGQTKCTKDCIDCLNAIDRRTQSTDECFYCPIADGCSWCFPAGTKISTPDGLKNIEDLSIGDEVIDKNGNIQIVENNMSRIASDELIYVKADEFEDTLTTKEHPFLAKRLISDKSDKLYSEPQWVKAGDLKLTDKIALFVPDTDEELNIKWSDVLEPELTPPKKEIVYNLTVSNTHSYIANGAIVHNCSAYNYQENGTPDCRVTYSCDMHKARSLANVYFWNKYYIKNNIDKVFTMHCPKEWALDIISEQEYNMLKKLEER